MSHPDQPPEPDRLDLGAWQVPPAPPGLADRVLARLVEDGAAPASAQKAVVPRGRWRRELSIGLLGAALAAAVTWWLVPGPAAPRALRPGAVASVSELDLGGGVSAVASPDALVRWQRRGDVLEIQQTRGRVTYRSAGGLRLRLATPVGVIDAGPEPIHLMVAPATEPMTATTPSMERGMTKRELAIGAASAAVAAGLVVMVYAGKASVRPTEGAAHELAAGEQLALAAPTASTPKPPLVAKVTRDRALRDQVAQALVAAQARRAAQVPSWPAAGGVTAAGNGPDRPPPALEPAQIRAGVRETIPMLADCYQQELLDRGVMADGQLIAHLVVETDPAIGTVVTFDDQQPIEFDFHTRTAGAIAPVTGDSLQAFGQCVELSLESVVLPPMAGEGRMAITYPFAFASSDDDEPGEPTGHGAGSGGDAPAQVATPSRRDAKPQTPREPQATTAAPLAPGASAAEMLAHAQRAAASAQYGESLAAAEAVFAGPNTAAERSKAATLAGLVACNTRDAAKAKKYFAMVSTSTQTLLWQKCLREGIDLKAKGADTTAATTSPPTGTAAELVDAAGAAFSASDHGRALTLAEQAYRARGSAADHSQAATIAGLSACALKRASTAKRYYRLARDNTRPLLRQRCLGQGIELED